MEGDPHRAAIAKRDLAIAIHDLREGDPQRQQVLLLRNDVAEGYRKGRAQLRQDIVSALLSTVRGGGPQSARAAIDVLELVGLKDAPKVAVEFQLAPVFSEAAFQTMLEDAKTAGRIRDLN